MSKIYSLRISPKKLMRLLHKQDKAAHGHPELFLSGRNDFLVQEDFDWRAYGLKDGNHCDLVEERAEFTIEPRIERDYWILSLLYSKNLGPRPIWREGEFYGGELTFEEFSRRFLVNRDGNIKVRLIVQTPEAKRHFDDWWASLQGTHRTSARRHASKRKKTKS